MTLPTTRPYPLLSGIFGPEDLGPLSADALDRLAAETRAFLVDKVCATGGHLGPNLGMVELSIALHRVFDSPTDTLLFDTGHQAYVHKMLTGRAAAFDTLRQEGGLSGYPSRAESDHDVIENSHASTALAYADGIAKARRLAGESHRRTVAVIGDGALTGGLAFEALNNLGSADRPVVVVLNDNERSYAPTIGGLADHLQHLRADAPDTVDWLIDSTARAAPSIAPLPLGRSLFELLGLAYIGPVDGHHLPSLEEALAMARDIKRPVVVHVVTTKGKGHEPSENDPADCFHAVAPIDADTGTPLKTGGAPSWTSVFSRTLLDVAEDRPDLVAITAAMPGPTGLAGFAAKHPERCFDVGIAEQHAVASAAGLALGGLHPVVAVYATFLGRAFDQVLMDVALHRAPVTFVLDRAGITGPDGPSHHGMWDLTILGAVPGMRVAAPRDATRLAELLAEAAAYDAGPTALRFPKASVGPDIDAVEHRAGLDVLHASGRDVLIVAIGPLAEQAVAAARRLDGENFRTTVADPRWVLPVSDSLVALAASHRLVVTVEDNTRGGGAGTALARALQDAGSTVPVRVLGLPGAFIAHGPRPDLLAQHGLDASGIRDAVRRAHAGLTRGEAE